LKSYRESLALREGLVKTDPGNAQWQRELALSYEEIGNVLVAQGSLPEALDSYRGSLAIVQRLAQAHPGNTGWQRDLSIFLEKIGNVLVAQGNAAEALKSYRESLAIRERLVKADPDNTLWQRDLWASYNEIGDVLVTQGDLAEALTSFRGGLAIAERLAKADPGNRDRQTDLQSSVSKIGSLSYRFALAHDFSHALEAADLSIAVAPGLAWIHANRAYALMFLGRVDEARAVYLGHRGELIDGKSWEAAVLEDFAELRKAGLTHPLMDEIEKLFSAHG
jgi:tetratricopeptide (TPR) repeat protein